MLKVAENSWGLTEFDKALLTASYFGFMPVAAPKITPADIEAAGFCTELVFYDAAEKAAMVRHYAEHDFASLPHPLALAYRRKSRAKSPEGYSLHFIGAATGIAEASLIRAALSILSDAGYKNLRVDINSVGDKDSIASYERELINYAKRSIGSISAELKEHLKADIWNLFRHDEEEALQLRAGAPSSLSCLTTPSRLLFKEVLEYLESLTVDFRLEPTLVGEKRHCSHTIFAIRGADKTARLEERGEEILAVGYRYSRLMKKLSQRREVPMAGVSIYFPEERGEAKVYSKLPKPKFYLIQLGREAKMKTLNLLENLRVARIPVHHFLGKDKLDAQLKSAEELRVTHLIIIGHKEALDGTATVRNVATRAQDTIALELLPQYLKKISL